MWHQQRWSIGLSIESQGIYAVALRGTPAQWSVAERWFYPLAAPSANPLAQWREESPLLSVLRQWSKRLPRHYSLRLGLPPNLVLQHALPRLPSALSPRDVNRYLQAAVERLLPDDPQQFCWDYRQTEEAEPRIILTIARRETLDQYIQLLAQAGLKADVFDLQSTGLSQLLERLDKPEGYLLYQGDDLWIWVARHSTGWEQGWGYRQQYSSAEQLRSLPSRTYSACYFCGRSPLITPPGFIHYPYASLAKECANQCYPRGLAVALGLALRSEDP